MPQRFLRPGLTTSKRFNAVDTDAQSFYVRLLTLVDDFGRYDGDPRLLRSHTFPLGDHKGDDVPMKTIAHICEQLSAQGLVQFYRTADGRDVLQVLRWQERPRAEKSRFPEFDSTCEQMFAACEQSLASLVPRSNVHRSSLLAIAATDAIAWSAAGGWQGVDALREEFRAAYPACDFDRQLAQAAAWLKANPAKAKKSNWRKFLTGWFKREQDRGGDLRGQKEAVRREARRNVPPQFIAWMRAKYPEHRPVWKWWDDVPDYLRSEFRQENREAA